MRPKEPQPPRRYMTPAEFEDARWANTYAVVSTVVTAVLVVGLAVVLVRAGWTVRDALVPASMLLLSLVPAQVAVYLVWGRARQRKRGGRR